MKSQNLLDIYDEEMLPIVCTTVILFLSFLLAKEQQWERQEKDPVFISQRLSLFAMCRLVLQILTCVAVVFTPLNIFGYLVGLLTLTLMTLVDKVVKLIKE